MDACTHQGKHLTHTPIQFSLTVPRCELLKANKPLNIQFSFIKQHFTAMAAGERVKRKHRAWLKVELNGQEQEVRSERAAESVFARVVSELHIGKQRRLQYLPANCLIGELFHPIELLLHFRVLCQSSLPK